MEDGSLPSAHCALAVVVATDDVCVSKLSQTRYACILTLVHARPAQHMTVIFSSASTSSSLLGHPKAPNRTEKQILILEP